MPDRAPTSTLPATELLLRFQLDRHHYALRADVVESLLPLRPPRRIPGAPPGVLGVGAWRGRPLTVLDFPRLVGASTTGSSVCLVRLAPPLQHAALYLPSTVQLHHAVLEPLREALDRVPFIDSHRCGEETLRVVDPTRLVRTIAAGLES
jgi:hypothetical protein